MSIISFDTVYSPTLEGVFSSESNATIYAEDLGLCQTCVDLTTSCFACLQTTQTIFYTDQLTNPVMDGYYMVNYGDSMPPGIWYIVAGLPQEGGYYNGVE